ncbi:hypothetical protein DFH06DRAFT_1292749 [Mycena polygramma]|nr:hypothetical protein DFH06DRAFT_1292749 [Mycena polygramma]
MPRVKSFELNTTFENSDFFEAIGWSLPAECIFPNLEELDWETPHPGDCAFRYLNLFLTPRLRNLSLTGFNGFADLCVFEKIAVKCPSLKHFFLGWPDENRVSYEASTAVVSTFVCRLKNLETLNVPDLDIVALAHVAQLPRMKDLAIRSERLIPSHFPHRGVFPALVELALWTMEQASAMFTALGECSLTAFMLLGTGSQPPTNHVARKFYSTLANSCSHSTLRDIRVSGNRIDSSTMSTEASIYSIGGEILEPLFSFTNLVSVVLSHPVGFDLDDATIALLARAWPQIERLTLEAGSTWHVPSRVTLRGLASFAQHCRHLRTLHLTLDARVISPINQNDEPRVSQTTLVYLHVAVSPVGDSQSVAEFLFEIFPALEDIRTLYDDISTAVNDDVEQRLRLRLLSEAPIGATHKIWKDVEVKHLMLRNPYP